VAPSVAVTSSAPKDGFRAIGDALVWLYEAFERVRAANDSAWLPGSPAAGEIRAASGVTWKSDDVRNAWVDLMLPLASAGDHLMTLADVLRGSRGQFASYTLARGAVEAATKTWHLAEPGVDADERARRRANDRLASLQAQVWLLEGAGEDASKLRARIDAILNSARGHYAVKVAKGFGNPPFVGAKPPTEMELLRGVLGQASQGVDVGGTTYRLLSGVAHAAGYGLVQMIESMGPDARPGVAQGRVRQSSPIAAAHFLAVPVTYVEAANRVIDGYGWDSSAWTDPMVEALTVWRDHARQV